MPGKTSDHLAKTHSVALVGTDARLVEVEVHAPGNGLPAFRIVGLPAKSVTEAEQRTRAAFGSLGDPEIGWPTGRITANLAPGALRKEGTHYDLAIALGALAARGHVDVAELGKWIVMGELALDGDLRPIPGVLPAAIECRRVGLKGIICPRANAQEAMLIDGIEVIAPRNLKECFEWFNGDRVIELPPSSEAIVVATTEDLSEVRGQANAKRALEIAAAGGHNLMLFGPPGAGKTMLARRLSGILPAMSVEESLEVTRIHSVAGLLGQAGGLITERPFRAPHHGISMAGLVGGGTGLPRPGEVSLAHCGVLFLDEISLFRRDVLDSLRGPLEDGSIRVARSAGMVMFPARITLIGAMNPCPCGRYGDPRRPCRCDASQLHRYATKVSGPLLDRFDMQVAMEALTRKELLEQPPGENSEAVRNRVEMARLVQHDRGGATNATISQRKLRQVVDATDEARKTLGDAVDAFGLSGRGFVRVMRVARTIADLESSTKVEDSHIWEALTFRLPDFLAEVA